MSYRFLLILLAAGVSMAQQTVDNSGAARTTPQKVTYDGEPGRCAIGESYFNGVTGKKRFCIARNIWADDVVLDASGSATIGGTVLGPNGADIPAAIMPAEGNRHQQARNFRAQLAKIMLGDSSTYAKVAVLGHSWVEGKTITTPLMTWLQNQYGYSGAGWTPFYSTSALPYGAGRTSTGTWTNISGTGLNVVGSGPDLYAASSTDVATPATVKITIPLTTTVNGAILSIPQTLFDVHYCTQTGGGDFTYAVNAQAPVTVHTSGSGSCASGTGGYAHTGNIAVTGAPVTSKNQVIITVTAASSAGVFVYGVDWTNAVSGVKVHSLGISGSTTSDWTKQNATNWEAGLTALDPTTVIYQCVVNDWAGQGGAAAFIANIATMVSRIQAAVPNADIILVADPQNGQTFTPAMATYEQSLRSYALANNIGLIDLYALWGSSATQTSRGLLNGGTFHPTTDGGSEMANIFASYLVSGVTAQSQPLFPTASPAFVNQYLSGFATTCYSPAINIGSGVVDATITPTCAVQKISGTGSIKTITVPAWIQTAVSTGTQTGCIALLPTAAWTLNTNGNINRPSTAASGKILMVCYDPDLSAWDVSY